MTYFPRATLMIGTPGILLCPPSQLCADSKTDRHDIAPDLPNPPFQITVVCADNVNTMLHDTVDKTVVSIYALVVAPDSFESGILGDTQSKPILLAQFLQLGKNTVGHNWNALGIETVHHCWNHIELVMDRQREEICVHQDRVRRRKGFVILEEQRRRNLWPVTFPLAECAVATTTTATVSFPAAISTYTSRGALSGLFFLPFAWAAFSLPLFLKHKSASINLYSASNRNVQPLVMQADCLGLYSKLAGSLLDPHPATQPAQQLVLGAQILSRVSTTISNYGARDL